MRNFTVPWILRQLNAVAAPPSEPPRLAGRGQGVRHVSLPLALLLLPLLAVSATPVFAHADSPGSLPLKPHSLRLQHRRPAEILALFAQEQRPDLTGHIPRATSSDSPESLLPSGTDAIYRTRAADELVVVAREGAAAVEACIRELDVPSQPVGLEQEKIVLTLRRARALDLRAAVLRLSGAGSATATGQQLVLVGRPAWLHRALRRVIRVELGVPEPLGTHSR